MVTATLDQKTAEVFRAIDARRADEFASFFAPDASFRFANAETVVGRDAIEQAVGAFFSSLRALQHDITGVWTGTWEQGEVVSVEAYVTYTRQDGSKTDPLPATSTLRMKGGAIQDYRIFIDLSPLFAAGEPEGGQG
jgi:ketosteroid isomerase-like protein